MKGWVGLVGWPIADGLPTLVVTHQLQVERRTGEVRRPETDVLPMCHATNLPTRWRQKPAGIEITSLSPYVLLCMLQEAAYAKHAMWLNNSCTSMNQPIRNTWIIQNYVLWMENVNVIVWRCFSPVVSWCDETVRWYSSPTQWERLALPPQFAIDKRRPTSDTLSAMHAAQSHSQHTIHQPTRER